MKTEISRNSHQPDKHYSGVYQQQGRMLTDADWNEQADIGKQRQDEVLRDAIGSGSPKDGGIIGSGNQLQWGTVYVDGIRGELRPDNGDMTALFRFDQQADLPLPASTGPANDDVLFLDVWERAVSGVEDPELVDPALAGADTCTRMQTMTQLKWCAAGDMPDSQGAKSKLTVTASAGFTGSASNYLFRLEVHAYTADEVVLKWSRENAAEQYKRPTSGGKLPDDFTQGTWVYEYFTEDSEKFSGFLGKVAVPPSEVAQLDPAITPSEVQYPYVRRWDGYCVIAGGTTKASDLGSVVAVSQTAGSLTVELQDFTLNIDVVEEILAGDYWQFPVRKDAPSSKIPPIGMITTGIAHHYLPLGISQGGDKMVLSAALAKGAMAFPSLREMHDTFVNVSGDTMTGKLHIKNKLDVDGDLTVTGNMTVNGDTTKVNVSEMEVEDNILRVNKYSARPTPLLKNGGLEVFRGGTAPNGQMIWNESVDKWMAGVAGNLKELAYGPKWESLTNGSDASGLHRHSKLVPPDGFPNPALSVDNNGKIGIGTTSPQSRLDVAGGQWNLSLTEGDLRIGNRNYRLKVGVAVAGGGRGDVRLRAHGGTNRLILGGGTNDTLTVTAANVGIGTILPTEKLDVRGNVKAASFIGDGSRLTGIAAGKWANAVGAGKIHYSGGNVGIGTNRPLSALHVQGGCRVEQNMTVKGRLYGAVEGPGGEDYRIANGQTARSTTRWRRLSANAIFVDVNTSSAGFVVTPQYFFNLLGDAGHHTVMGVGCVSNPTKTGFRVYLHRESGLTVNEAKTNKWYIQWTAVGHDRMAGFVLHPILPVGALNVLRTNQGNALGAYHTQLTGRITLLNRLNASISNPITGLAAVRNKTNTTYSNVFNSSTGLAAVRKRANAAKSAVNANAKLLASKYSTGNVALIASTDTLSTGTFASLKLNNSKFANRYL